MKEIRDILKANQEAIRTGRRRALATVVKVEGSSYRRPGARMLVTEDGQLTGAISGGCLEGDALRKALYVMNQQKPMLVTYDTNDEDDAKIGVGLGCNGIIHILIEPLLDNNNPLTYLDGLNHKREKAVLVTLFNSQNKAAFQVGSCYFSDGDVAWVKSDLENELLDDIQQDAMHARSAGVSSFSSYFVDGEGYTAFIEVILPPVALKIVGAGNDVIPLVRIADVLGWDAAVYDGRPALLQASRFPGAREMILTKAEDFSSKCSFDSRTVVVLMTHNYNYELTVLRDLLATDLPYLGVLGPKKKLNRMLSELAGQGVQIDEGTIGRLYGPVGFDIGAETSEEIALSIAAEIKAVLSGRAGGSLRDKNGPIHEPGITESIQAAKV
ncbi:XdhC family protein [Pedobacter sp. SYSU D00535]|uniref:XdhC family protein n=1 Tax=Pedobacter sp. SYSU D00535 TaxID=2810308 RepID=UPI001A95C573|nr:XdhC/CoxI family protein [Pedobacter sp. SYSU D00535]